MPDKRGGRTPPRGITDVRLAGKGSIQSSAIPMGMAGHEPQADLASESAFAALRPINLA